MPSRCPSNGDVSEFLPTGHSFVIERPWLLFNHAVRSALEVHSQLGGTTMQVGLTIDDLRIARSLCTLLASATCEPSTPTLASDWAVTPIDQRMGEETPERWLELSTRTPPRPAHASHN